MSEDAKKLSAVEGMKVESKFLKGDIFEELTNDAPDVSDYTYEMMKFHGSYFGYDRDSATERKKQGLDKLYEFMVRLRIPAGKLSAEQYIEADKLAETYANATLKLTTRQTIQMHCIEKKGVIPLIKAFNESGLSTLSACGDVVRNVTATNAPYSDAKYQRLMSDVERIVEMCEPKTTSYKEIWCGKEESNREAEPAQVEPLYGDTYLPRKFKIGLILPEDNGIDVFSHDLGFVLIYDGDELKGYNILIGGGMGMKHNKPKTYARAADVLCFIDKDDLLPAVEAVVKLQRDNGDRTDRQHARLKYVVQENGLPWIREQFESYFAKAGGKSPVKDAVPVEKYSIPEYMGWGEQGDGKWFIGVHVPSGRVVDCDKEHKSGYTDDVTGKFAKAQYRTFLRNVAEQLDVKFTITADQNILICDIAQEDKPKVDALLQEHNIPLREDYSTFERHFFTCVALPTCGKALAEAERVQFAIMDNIKEMLDAKGLVEEKISIRVTGCPNGCARPSLGDIGIVGRMPGHYVIQIGGDFEGTRINKRVLDKVPQEKLADALEPMFAKYVAERQEGEGFGNFSHRVGIENVAKATEDALSEQYKWAKVSLV